MFNKFENYLKLAKNLVYYACDLKPKEKVLIEESYVDPDFICCLIEEVRKAGAYPFVISNNLNISKALLNGITEEEAKLKTKYMLPIMQDMDAYITLRGKLNSFEESDIDTKYKQIDNIHFLTPVHLEERVNNTKWCILRWPNPSFAQSAGISTDALNKLYFEVCTLDYAKMDKAMDRLVESMEKTDKVRIVGNGTDITFSIKNQPAIKCSGKHNIPDGEVFTAPIKNSINGVISFNIPTLYQGVRFDDIKLEVENGKIINATSSSNTKKLNEILDIDAGARYFGEFAIGVNPYVKKPMLDILFDEKICGSIHLTPGNDYEEAPNGNKSAIHWDMVLCQLEEFGGGEIYFDDVLIRKNGIFVPENLKCLNPDNLM